MKIGRKFLGLLAMVGFMGALMVGTAQALDFGDWNQVWFKVQVKENPDGKKAKIGDAIPPETDSVSKYQDNFKIHLVVEACTVDLAGGSCDVTVCTFNGTVWGREPTTTWPLLAGNAQKFLTLFDVTFTENPVTPIVERLVLPLRVKASVKNDNPHQITGAVIENLGGAFLATFGNPPVQYATGAVKIESTWIKPSDVDSKVPTGCKIPIP